MRARRYGRVMIGWMLFALLMVGWVWAMGNSETPAPTADEPVARLSDDDRKTFSERFEKDIWSLLTRPQSNCVACHGKNNPSQLHLLPEADASFTHLLNHGFFDPESPTGLLARVTALEKERRMPPPPFPAWTEQEQAVLRSFVNDIFQRQRKDAPRADEQFPIELLTPFKGQVPQTSPDNTFITYYQLKRKVLTVFGDDWRRSDRDVFHENITLFGGADFVRTFNESSKPSATFLSGVDMLARDIATRAYINRTGPFDGRPQTLPAPLPPPSPPYQGGEQRGGVPATYRREIKHLYNRLLFRDATEEEIRNAFRFIQSVYREEKRLALQPQELHFELTVRDEDGLTTTQDFTIQVTNDHYGLYQEFINQNAEASGHVVKRKLNATFTFKANDDGQRFEISNAETSGNVSIAGIELKGPLPKETTKTIMVNDPSVQIIGAWRLINRDNLTSYDDNNEDKGNGSIAIPIRVPQEGQYELSVIWRKNDSATEQVLVEVRSHDSTRHVLEPPKPVPPPGEAHFVIDQTVDNIAFWDLKPLFRFGPDGGVEINNAGTRRTVVADAAQFVHAQTGEKFLVRGVEAQGKEEWEEFNPGSFRPYNTIGPKLFSDGNKKKGKLKLLYKPSVRKEAWAADAFYRVQLACPGKAGNETQAPVVVRAQTSSPIIQLRSPRHVHAGGKVEMDAANTYNLQRSGLHFMWTQTGGPRVELSDPHAPTVTFTAPVMTAQQAAWEGLCRALVKHPDFLFTRPPSLASVKNQRDRRRLQLVKIAQDLVARPPTPQELNRLDEGASLMSFIRAYIETQEFKDFYFHRVRLNLESHGTPEEDEPARLWAYIAFNDRPFKAILTADYTVDENFQRQKRPDYHGQTGLLTMKGFIKGKPGLPHFNYAAMVCEKFLGYVFEVPPSIVEAREGITAAATTSPSSVCYSCHKILTPLAYQRLRWTDDGTYKEKDEDGKPIDDSDRGLVASYPFKGQGMEAFALQSVNKERFIRTVIQTHFVFYFGREMRYNEDERTLYKRVWDVAHKYDFSIKALIRGIMTSPEYLNGGSAPPALTKPSNARGARTARRQ